MVPNYCLPLPNVTNGVLNYAGYTLNSNLTLTCNPGFQPSQTGNVLTCTQFNASNGNWNGLLACDIITNYCPSLNASTYGSVNYTNNSQIGSFALFSCDEGYQISGTPNLTCNPGTATQGNWSAPAPTCALIPHYCPLITIPNTLVNYSNPNRYLNSTAQIVCKNGSVMVPNIPVVLNCEVIPFSHSFYLCQPWANELLPTTFI